MRRHAGFSLIETIFAAATLLLVLMLLFTLYPSSMLGVRRAEHRLEALTLAQSLIEKYSAGPFRELTALEPDQWYDDDLPAPKEDGAQLLPRHKVFHIDGADAGRMLGIAVEVQWDENERSHQRVFMEQWICDVKR